MNRVPPEIIEMYVAILKNGYHIARTWECSLINRASHLIELERDACPKYMLITLYNKEISD